MSSLKNPVLILIRPCVRVVWSAGFFLCFAGGGGWEVTRAQPCGSDETLLPSCVPPGSCRCILEDCRIAPDDPTKRDRANPTEPLELRRSRNCVRINKENWKGVTWGNFFSRYVRLLKPTRANAFSGYGEVYKAIYKPTGKLVAVKVMEIESEVDARSVEEEIKLIKAFDSPFVVKYYGSYFKHEKLWVLLFSLALSARVSLFFLWRDLFMLLHVVPQKFFSLSWLRCQYPQCQIQFPPSSSSFFFKKSIIVCHVLCD